MFTFYYSDMEVLRIDIKILNEKIEAYGCIGVDFIKEFISGEEPTFKDTRIGWTEIFSEARDVQPELRGGSWIFKFTLPEPKEL